MHEIVPRLRRPLLLIPLLVAVGCSSDERVVELSRESLNRQAEQNAHIARQSQSVAETTKQLIQAESQAQATHQNLQRQLHAERVNLDRQHEDLETERRTMAAQRHRDPIIAQTIAAVVGLLVAALPLVICVYIVRTLADGDESMVAQALIEQMAEQPLLLDACHPLAVMSDTPDASADPLPLTHDLRRLGLISTVGTERSKLHVIVVVEGIHDVEFLRRISRVLAQTSPHVRDLATLEACGALAFRVNNGTFTTFPSGLSTNGPREFHLYDREAEPASTHRQLVVRAINVQPQCIAQLTRKRAMENYLHPDAIREARHVNVAFGDDDDVAALVARAGFQPTSERTWDMLSRRSRRRLRDKAKRWLNREAVDRMTSERLAERDPDGEIIGWLNTIAELAAGQPAAPPLQ